MEDEVLGTDTLFPVSQTRTNCTCLAHSIHAKEAERPPSPEPTVEIFERDKDSLTVDDSAIPHSGWDRISIRLVGSHPLWGHHL